MDGIEPQILSGVVTEGRGDFGKWIDLYQDACTKATGLSLYPGTLNLRLNESYRVPVGSRLLDLRAYGGRLSVYLVSCAVFDRPALILRTEANERGEGDHPYEIIEVATDVRLRDIYRLEDGMCVDIVVGGHGSSRR